MLPGKRLSELDMQLQSSPQMFAAQTGLRNLVLSQGLLLLVLLTPGRMHPAGKRDNGPAGFSCLAQHSTAVNVLCSRT